MDDKKKLTPVDIISGQEVDSILISGIRKVMKEGLELAMKTLEEPTEVVVLVPIITKKKFEVLEFSIENFANDAMMCNGCGKDMGPLNPKGVFKTSDGWFRLCYQCCVNQGFIK